jgi:hypothetical protein
MQSRDLNASERPRLQRRPGATRAAMLMGFLLLLPLVGAQNAPTGHIGGLPQPLGQGVGDSPLGGLNSDDPDQVRRIRMLNAERQKSLVADTVKLLKLANELNMVMAKENESAPTQAELRKVADIEKLAHNVSEKMKITVIGSPVYRDPRLPPIP